MTMILNVSMFRCWINSSMMVYLVIIPAAVMLGFNVISYAIVLNTYFTSKNAVQSVIKPVPILIFTASLRATRLWRYRKKDKHKTAKIVYRFTFFSCKKI